MTNESTFELMQRVIDMDLLVRVEIWCMGPCCTVTDDLYPEKGCAQLRGESGPNLDMEASIRDACLMAINHLHPADPDFVQTRQSTK